MTLNTYPLDTATIMANTESIVALDPVVDMDTGEQRRDRNGVLRWKLTVVYNDPASYRRELLEIGFAHPKALEPGPGDQLVMTGLSGRPWQRTNAYGTNSGFAVSAETVAFQSPNNNRRPVEPATSS